MSVVISARNVTKRYRLPDEPLALVGINLDVFRGEVFGLLGPNGAGKSTLIAILTGLFPPTQGEIQVAGYDVVRQPIAVKRVIGVVPEEIALYPSMSGIQNLRFFGELHNPGKTRLDTRIQQVLDLIDLADRGNDRVATYSNGMKRRLNIGIAMLHDPPIYFMDEPTLGLDPENRHRIIELVKKLRRDENRTFLYTTHNMTEAEEISDRVGIIHAGKIIAIGSPGELIQSIGAGETIEMHIAVGEIPLDDLKTTLEKLPQIHKVVVTHETLTISLNGASTLLPQIITLCYQAGLQILSLDIQQPNLETVFLNLTGVGLKDQV